MRNRRNWVPIILLAILIISVTLTGCAEKRAESTLNAAQQETKMEMSELQQAKSKLLTEWFELLEANEAVYSGMFRIMEYTEAYGQDNSWDSLLKARAVSSAALVAVRQMELPVLNLTEEEISLLTESGVEVNAVQREFEGLTNWHTSKENTASLFCYTLEDDVFMRASVEDAIPAMAAFYRDYFTLEYRYLIQFSNYLLLQTESEDIWQLWTSQLPCMAACTDTWYDNTEDLERVTGQLLNEMEALQTQMGSFLGVSKYTLEIVREAVETGDLEALRREINEISGVPGYFPVPGWLPDVIHLYLAEDPENQENRLIRPGEELNSAPSACYISCGEISLEDVEAYGEQLKLWGMESYGTWNDAKDAWQLLAKSGSSTMMIKWTADETLLYLTEPVGCLIPELYLYAMAIE